MLNFLKSFTASTSTSQHQADQSPPVYSANQEIPAPPQNVPPGWAVEWSPEHSRYYWINMATNASQWEDPSKTPVSMYPGQIRMQQVNAERAAATQQQQVVEQEALPSYAPPPADGAGSLTTPSA